MYVQKENGQAVPYRAGSNARSYAIECKCIKIKRALAFGSGIPPEYRRHNLARLRPDVERHPVQAEIVPFVKENPDQSYLLIGRNRTGKSHIAWCLARHALLAGRRVTACNLATLLDEYRQCERPRTDDEGPTPRPRILASDMESRAPHTLMIQEFDKPRPSEYAAERLFELIDAAFNFRHQLIVTSNLGVDELTNHWGRQGSRYGSGIVSRIVERCIEVNFF